MPTKEDELAEKDEEIEQLKTRVSELERCLEQARSIIKHLLNGDRNDLSWRNI